MLDIAMVNWRTKKLIKKGKLNNVQNEPSPTKEELNSIQIESKPWLS